MYKIFGNSHLIILAQKKEKDFLVNNEARMFKNIGSLVKEIKRSNLDLSNQVLAVVGNNPHELFSTFAKHFIRVNAAGGLVFNQSKQILLMLRNGYWDLPKGKQDPGERIATCAVREVREECGIKKIQLGNKITHTYHYYFMRGTWQLKKTSWYKMKVAGKPVLTPQKSEGISKVQWAGAREIRVSLRKTFPLVHDLLVNHYPH